MKKESKTYQIRYNTVSKNDTERWRLIENGNEILISDIIINGLTHTTKDWMEEINDYKWHISCVGYCEVKNNTAYIKTGKGKSLLKRQIAKAITFRIIGTIDTILVSWFITGSFEVGAILGGIEIFTKIVLYFAHERVWDKYIKYGLE